MGKHGTPVKKDKLHEILGELDKTAKDLGVADVKAERRAEDQPAHRQATADYVAARTNSRRSRSPPFAEGLAMVGLDKDLAAGKPIAPRKAYGAALVALGAADKRVVGLDADVKNSTHAEWFAKKFPAQYLECKIAEQNMISTAAGLSAAGKIPFCLHLRQVRRPRLRPGRDGDHRRGEPQDHRHPRRRHPRRRRAQPDVAAGRRLLPQLLPRQELQRPPRRQLLLPRRRRQLLQDHRADGQPRRRAATSATLRAETKILYKPEETFEVGGFKVAARGQGRAVRRRRLHGPRVPEGRRRTGQEREEGDA